MSAEDLGWKGWLVIACLIVAFLLMGADKVGPDITFTVLLAFFTACRIVTPAEAAAGYANTGLLTVIFLYLVSEGIYQTGALEGVVTYLLGRSRSPFWALVRMMIPTMVLSAFLNNTPVVSLLTPILISWARRSGVPVKKLLIPLSYAAVLGGTCTLIGTSTNLVVSGAQATRYEKLKRFEDVKFKIFDIAPYGVPYAIWGFLFVLATQSFLLPGNSSRFARDLLLALRVLYHSPVRGKTLLESGLTRVYGARVAAILRKGVWISNPETSTVLQEGDVLYFAGELDQVEYLGEELGLQLVTADSEDAPDHGELRTNTTHGHGKLVQVTLKSGTYLEGSHISQAQLRERYDVALVGYARKKKFARSNSGLNQLAAKCGLEHPLSTHKVATPDTRLSQLVLTSGTTLVLSLGPSADTASPAFAEVFTQVYDIREKGSKEFIVALDVLPGPVAGKTASQAGLRGIPGLSVLALDRRGNPEERTEPVLHGDVLQAGDVLWVGADLSAVIFLAKFPGLTLSQQKQADKTGVSKLYQTLVQAVVSANGALVGKSPRELLFRRKYGASVMAIHREGLHAPQHASLTVLQPGDVLLLSASDEWCAKHRNDRNFTLVQDVLFSNPPKKNRGLIAVALGVGMVITQIVPGVANKEEWINLWPAAVLTAALMLLLGCMSGNNARASILWDVYLAIAGAFGVSKAMEVTGAAYEFAQLFVKLAEAIGGRSAALTSIYIATALLSEILTNNAAGAIMFPIAAIAGDQLGVSPRAISVAVMLGASAGFINPFSYQCNMMVYVAGNYRTLEFAKIGAPFQMYLLVVAGFILSFYDSWQAVWIISFCVAGGFIGFPLLYALLPARTQLVIETKVARWFRFLHRRKDQGAEGYGSPARSDSGSDAEPKAPKALGLQNLAVPAAARR